MSGPILALLAAISWACEHIVVRRAVLKIKDPTVGVLVAVPAMLPFFLVILVVLGRAGDIFLYPWQSYMWLSIAGALHFFAGRSFSYVAIDLLGANTTAIFSRINPIVAAMLGILVLNEPMTWKLVVGVLMIAFGISAVSFNPMSPGRLISNLSKKGILAALGAGFCYGTSSLFVKLGLQESLSSVSATFISFAAATVLLAGSVVFSQKRRSDLLNIGNGAYIWILAGFFPAVAQLLRYAAFAVAPISIIAPLYSTNPIFLLGLSFVFNRKLEVFHPRVIAGIVITVAGAILLV